MIAFAFIAATVVIFSRALLHWIGEPRWSITLALGAMLLTAVTATIARVTENLSVALGITGAVAAAGICALWRARPLAPLSEAPDARPYPLAAGLAVVGLVLVAWAALRNHLWDEYNGHFPILNVLARGVVPPEHPFFPGEPFRYHYAFDVLAGEVRALAGVETTSAIDVATIACFAMLLVASASAGAALGGRMGSSLAVLLVPFGGGTLSYLLLPELGPLEVRWSILPPRWLTSVPPPVISNFFQHPQGLAMSVSLAVLLLFAGAGRARADPARRARVLLGSLLLGSLSLAQIVFFSVLGLALGALVVVRALNGLVPRDHRGRDFTGGALELALLAVSPLVAIGLGGFFEGFPSPATTGMIRFGRTFFGEPFLPALAHHLVLFGLPLLCLPAAVLRWRSGSTPLRVAVFVAAVVGFVVPNVAVYERSWDIVKFFGIGAFFANLAFVDVLLGILAGRGRWRRLALLLAVTASLVGWFWIVRMSAIDGQLGVPKMHFPAPPAIAERVRDRLASDVPPRDRVFSTNMEIGMAGGFLTPGFDWRTSGESYLVDRRRLDGLHLHKERARRTLRPEDLEALDVRWAILSPGDIEALEPEGRAALLDRARFEHLFDVEVEGDVRHIYRILR